MARAKPPKNASQEILNRLTALNKKVDKGFKEAGKQFKGIADFRRQTEENFAAVNKRVEEGFKESTEFSQKSEENIANLAREVGEIGSSLFDKIEGNHREFLVFQQKSEAFQQQTLVFQEEMRIFKQQSLDFQKAMQDTIQHFTRVLERIDHNLSILEKAFENLKADHEKLKQEVASKDATIKKLEQALARFGAV